MATLRAFRRWVRLACVIFGVIGAASVVLMMFLVTTDVAGRAAAKPILGSYEMVELAMVIAVCSAFGVAQTNRFHVRIDVLVALLPPRVRAAVDCLVSIIGLAFIGTVAWMGISQTANIRDGDLITPLLRIPKWPFELWLTVGWILFFLALFADSLLTMGRALGKDGATEPTTRVEHHAI